MIRAGQLCPKGQSSTEMDCPCCDGVGCDECEKRGFIELTKSARNLVPSEMWEVLVYTDWMEKGLPPIAGGALDQDRWFLAAALYVASKAAEIQADALKEK